MESKNVTIYDVAKAVGCSPATVSLALNGDQRVSQKTREKVAKVASELKYQPSYFGRSLITGKSNSIKVVIPDIHNPIFINIVDGIEQYVGKTGYHVLLDVTNNSRERELESFDSLLEKRVDGIIISPIYENEVTAYIRKKKLDKDKIVYVGNSCSGDDSIHYCTSDSRKGAYLAIKHMLERGCKKVVFLAPIVAKNQGLRRKEGYFEAMEQFGLPRDPELIVNCSQDFTEIYQCTRKLIQEKKPDGIFCLYDYATIPVMKAVTSLGLRVPEDLMVTGYDNIEIGEFLDKPLTTVDPHQKELGYRSAEILIDILQGKKCPVQNFIEPTLVVRETTV